MDGIEVESGELGYTGNEPSLPSLGPVCGPCSNAPGTASATVNSNGHHRFDCPVCGRMIGWFPLALAAPNRIHAIAEPDARSDRNIHNLSSSESPDSSLTSPPGPWLYVSRRLSLAGPFDATPMLGPVLFAGPTGDTSPHWRLTPSVYAWFCGVGLRLAENARREGVRPGDAKPAAARRSPTASSPSNGSRDPPAVAAAPKPSAVAIYAEYRRVIAILSHFVCSNPQQFTEAELDAAFAVPEEARSLPEVGWVPEAVS